MIPCPMSLRFHSEGLSSDSLGCCAAEAHGTTVETRTGGGRNGARKACDSPERLQWVILDWRVRPWAINPWDGDSGRPAVGGHGSAEKACSKKSIWRRPSLGSHTEGLANAPFAISRLAYQQYSSRAAPISHRVSQRMWLQK